MFFAEKAKGYFEYEILYFIPPFQILKIPPDTRKYFALADARKKSLKWEEEEMKFRAPFNLLSIPFLQ